MMRITLPGYVYRSSNEEEQPAAPASSKTQTKQYSGKKRKQGDDEQIVKQSNPPTEPIDGREAELALPKANKSRSRISKKKRIAKAVVSREVNFSTFPAGKFLDNESLDKVEIKDDILELLDFSCWRIFVRIKMPAVSELLIDFYESFEFDSPDKSSLNKNGTIRFKLLNNNFTLSVNDFNSKLGFFTEEEMECPEYLDYPYDFPSNFDAKVVYKELTGMENLDFNPSKAKANLIINPCLRLIHRFLAYSFSYRKDNSAIVNKTELFLLWSLLNKKKINLGYWLATQFQNAVSCKRFNILGPFITLFAVNDKLVSLDNLDDFSVTYMEPLDLHCLDTMGLLRRESDGSFSFVPAGPIAPMNERIFRRGEPSPSPSQAPSSSQPSASSKDELKELKEKIAERDSKIKALEAEIAELKESSEVYKEFAERSPFLFRIFTRDRENKSGEINSASSLLF